MKNLTQTFQDIYIRHQVDMEENFKVDKVIIIHSDQLEDESKDGVLDVLSSKEDYYNHWFYWLKYLKTNYLDDIRMRHYVETEEKSYFDIVLACLNDYNDIIFLDFTDFEEQPRYSDGWLLIPSQITEKQYASLKEISNYIKQYKNIIVQGGKKVMEVEEFFDPLSEFSIEENLKGEDFETFLKDRLKKYRKSSGIER